MLASAFILGLFGGLHCVGMCGPIVLALPLTATEKSKIIGQSLVYHMGRILTYGIMGLVIGMFGWGIALAGYQQTFTILLGATLIISALFSGSMSQRLFRVSAVEKGLSWLRRSMNQSFSIRGPLSAFRIGLLNGLLPCGLVYVALAGAAVSGCMKHGFLYMTLFGLGTLPWMVAVMAFGNLFKHRLTKFKRWIPLALLLFGIYLLVRGIVISMPADLDQWMADGLQAPCH